MKTIELIINCQGEVRLQTHGFAGGSCIPTAEFLRKSLGHVAQETRTPAFYSADTEATSPLCITPPSH